MNPPAFAPVIWHLDEHVTVQYANGQLALVRDNRAVVSVDSHTGEVTHHYTGPLPPQEGPWTSI